MEMGEGFSLRSYDDFRLFDITPIEEYNGILYKRDDKYMPFEDIPLSGGKVRQAICLLHENYEMIRNECNRIVITATSVHSPQGIIIARTAKEFGFRCILVVGNTNNESMKKNPLMVRSSKCGALIDYKCKQGYENPLMARIREIKGDKNIFVVKFGINLETNPDAIINSVAYQVKNIPDDLDVLVVPVGSAITFGGILKGLKKYNKKPKRVIGVQIAGYDRKNVIKKILGEDEVEYEFYIDKTYPYSKKVNVMFNINEDLDCIYESKAYDWMMKNIDIKNNKTLFWIVGNSNFVRNPL